MPYADLNSTTLSGESVAFSSNTLTLDIDGDKAKAVPYLAHKIAHKRTELDTRGCSRERGAALQTALSNCADLANNAASAAQAGHKMQEYFKSSSSSVIRTVAARFKAVADECATTNSGVTESSCEDEYGACQSGVIAYTLPSQNYIAYCDIFYDDLQAISKRCHGQDRATTVLHEKTHVSVAIEGPPPRQGAFICDLLVLFTDIIKRLRLSTILELTTTHTDIQHPGLCPPSRPSTMQTHTRFMPTLCTQAADAATINNADKRETP